MRGAPARAIQELAGHQDLATTQRYMHLSPAASTRRFGCWTQPDGSLRGEGGGGGKMRAEFAGFVRKSGGGGGSRTRVRKAVAEGLYMRIRFLCLVPGVRKRLKTAGHQTRKISRPRAGAPPAASLFNGVRPSTTRRGQANVTA